jgi:hypothetical protein
LIGLCAALEQARFGVWWLVRARHTFTGPIRTVEFDDGTGVQ